MKSIHAINRQKTCLVLGGHGFIGSHLVAGLYNEGYTVRVFARPNTVSLNPQIINKVRLFAGDLNNEACLREAIAGCDICFHLISTVLPKSSNLDPILDIETNLISTVRLLDLMVQAKVKKIIFLSSGGTVYGRANTIPIDESHATHPLCSYAINKLAIEQYLALYHQLHGLNYTIIRLANPFGEWQRANASQGAIMIFLRKALRQETVEIWGDGTVTRDYIYISDVINALIKTIDYDGAEPIFNIGSGSGFSLNQVLDSIEQIVEIKIKRAYLAARSFDVPVNILAIDRARKNLHWEPTVDFLAGIRKLNSWLRDYSNNPLTHT